MVAGQNYTMRYILHCRQVTLVMANTHCQTTLGMLRRKLTLATAWLLRCISYIPVNKIRSLQIITCLQEHLPAGMMHPMVNNVYRRLQKRFDIDDDNEDDYDPGDRYANEAQDRCGGLSDEVAEQQDNFDEGGEFNGQQDPAWRHRQWDLTKGTQYPQSRSRPANVHAQSVCQPHREPRYQPWQRPAS
jgi:hypothetical protein